MAEVSHVLHTPFTALLELSVLELYEWVNAARTTLKRLYGDGTT